MKRFHLSLFVFVLICTTSTSVSGIRVGQPLSKNSATRDEHVTVPLAQVSRISPRKAEKNVFRPSVKAPVSAVAAYIALRERQKQNLEADPMIENDVGESSLQPADEVVEAGPKKRRGRSKMLKVHARTVNEKKN
ncbi:hypothetical protein POM88_005055 [Heracleum sosnowskyi]|uniref:Uncharacterized protein n=1 Tax=Heracleum sosnowskyi TaxID=360622 RepID=A0AAD8N8A1_9APIA|nr:hypothetical protein POM88_005055 [Heracleum sosnowskyi]